MKGAVSHCFQEKLNYLVNKQKLERKVSYEAYKWIDIVKIACKI